MAVNPIRPKKKNEKYKVMALPPLIGVLLYVLWLPSKAEVPRSQAALSPPADATHAAVNRDQSLLAGAEISAGGATAAGEVAPGRRPGHSADRPVWPEIELAELTPSNPWGRDEVAPPTLAEERRIDAATSPTSAADVLHQSAQELGGGSIHYIFHSPRQKLVMIGEQLMRPGDRINEHVHVHDIQPHALILGRAPTSAP